MVAGLLAGCSEVETPVGYQGFNRSVKPILSDNCFVCHGPDAGEDGRREAGLRLDLFETATAELPESPGRFAIVPGDPDRSELIRRVTANDPNERMPPPETHKTVSSRDADILAYWISQGAEYERHWSYVAPTRPEVPATVHDANARNEIDHFVLARIEEAGLVPSDSADRHTLINRLYLDLTGLPPPLDRYEAFLADERPDAYERLVDEMLDSTAYAENEARKWMDIARFADTDGYLDDAGGRLLYPWRDWVIEAFERNMPFDEFSRWQLAGDLLSEPSREQLLATTFLRLGQRNTENGIIEEEFLLEYAIDRADVVGTGYLGHTVTCARCHDHKYDPISIRDFYEFSAFFGNANEPGYYPPRLVPLSMNTAGPTLLMPDDETRDTLDTLSSDVETAQAELSELLPLVTQRAQEQAQLLAEESVEDVAAAVAAALEGAIQAHYPFDEAYKATAEDLGFAHMPNFIGRGSFLPDGLIVDELSLSPSATAGVHPATIQTAVIGEGSVGNALYLNDLNKGFLQPGIGYFEHTDAFSLDLRLLPGDVYEEGVALSHQRSARYGDQGYALVLEDNRLRFDIVHIPPADMLRVIAVDALPVGEWAHVSVTYDGSSRASGVTVYVDGEAIELEVVRDSLVQSSLPQIKSEGLGDAMYGLSFGLRFQRYSIPGSGLDEIRVFDRELAAVEVAYLHAGDAGLAPEQERLRHQLTEMLVLVDDEYLASQQRLASTRKAFVDAYTDVPEIMVMGEDPNPRPAYVRNRGVYSDRGEEIVPEALERIFEWDENLPRNRLGLVDWLFDPDNPLTARVFVNRMWQSHFGLGLVESNEDFGSQGNFPSHPALLDWLAVEFIESGWDIRHMHRLIVNSATYRQSSDIRDEALALDPNNVFLARGVRKRLTAEVIRDNALASGGLLVDEVGGPSVYPYQPDGVWEVMVNGNVRYPQAEDVPADQHHRRSMYSYLKRAAPHPSMAVFDMAHRNTTIVRRRTSNTPLQALVLLNDQQYLETYEGLAMQALQAGRESDDQILALYRLALRREPGEVELDVLKEHFETAYARFSASADKTRDYLSAGVLDLRPPERDEAHFAALASVARVVMNSPDAYMQR